MSVKGRSARGAIVDFDLLAIKSKLSQVQTTVSLDSRREYVDARTAGMSNRQYIKQQSEANAEPPIQLVPPTPQVTPETAAFLMADTGRNLPDTPPVQITPDVLAQTDADATVDEAPTTPQRARGSRRSG